MKMGILVRRAEERGYFNHGWLDTYHTFSFGDYFDPQQMGFRALRVINEDRVQAGEGFGTHPHRDMEILTYVLEGALEHKDSMGNGSIIRPGEVQRMSAGTGITHSEYNHSKTELVHLLQIWILPEKKGITPGYEQKKFETDEKRGRLRLIASRDGRDGSVSLHQDVCVYTGLLEAGQKAVYAIHPKRYAWMQVARGAMTLNGLALTQGDGAAASQETLLTLVGEKEADLLLFDLA